VKWYPLEPCLFREVPVPETEINEVVSHRGPGCDDCPDFTVTNERSFIRFFMSLRSAVNSIDAGLPAVFTSLTDRFPFFTGYGLQCAGSNVRAHNMQFIILFFPCAHDLPSEIVRLHLHYYKKPTSTIYQVAIPVRKYEDRPAGPLSLVHIYISWESQQINNTVNKSFLQPWIRNLFS